MVGSRGKRCHPPGGGHVSLRTTTLWTLLLVLGIGAGLLFAVQRLLVFPEFQELEREEAREDAVRVRAAIEREAHHLNTFCGDWARSDALRASADARDAAPAASHFPIQVYRENRLSLVACVRPDGQMIWSRAYDLESGQEISIPGLSVSRLPAGSPLLVTEAGTSVAGLVSTPAGPFLVAAQPLAGSEGPGPARGTLVMARALAADVRRALATQTGVRFTLRPLGDPALSREERDDVLGVDKGGGVVLRETDDRVIGLARMNDLAGGPGFVLRADMPRRIAARAEFALQATTWSLALVGAALLGTLLWLLSRLVVAPVARLGQAVDRMADGAAPEPRGKGWAPREIVRLGDQVDHLYASAKAVEEDLRAAKEAAEGASRTKSAFLANVSHEVRTPLTGVLGMTHELLSTDLDADQRQCAERIRASGEALLGVLNDVLDLAKMEAGRLDIECVPFDLHALVADVADATAARVRASSVDVSFAIGPGVPRRISGDPTRLRQVLANLGANAVKFTHVGEVHLRVARDASGEDAPRLRFDVVDTGIGIPRSRMDRLFQRFSQVDPAVTRRTGGSGLGLAICRDLVERMGGRMDVTSAEGAGSTFSFTLPLHEAPPALPDPPPPADLSGVKVLVVGGAARSREALVERLAESGCRVEGAATAEQAMFALQAAANEGDPFRVVLADQTPVGGEGEALGRRVLGDPGLPPTHVVLLVSLGVRGDAARLASAGFSGYLTKPLRPWLVVEAVARVAGRAAGGSRDAGRLVTRHTLSEDRPKGARILLADDDEASRTVAARMLRRLGHDVESVVDGRAAVNAVTEGAFDLVLMDVEMPDMDGLEATEEIRRREESGVRLPVIALTAGVLKEDRERCLAAGMDDHLPKPIDPQRLAETVCRWWKPDPAAAPAEIPTSGGATPVA